MEKLYILEVAFKSSSKGRSGNAMADAASKAVDEALKGKMGATKQFAFKVVGENKMVLALEGDANNALEAINKELGMESIQVVCTPCYSYVTFAKDVLKCDEEICQPTPRKLVAKNKPFIWAFADVEYPDKPLEALRKEWFDEATFALPSLGKGDGQMQLYKEVGAKKVHMFVDVGFAELDSLTWTLPLYVANGHNIKFVAKEVNLL